MVDILKELQNELKKTQKQLIEKSQEYASAVQLNFDLLKAVYTLQDENEQLKADVEALRKQCS